MLVLRLKKCIFKNARIHKYQITAWGIATSACGFSSRMFVVPWGFFYIKLQIFSVPFVVRTTMILFICVTKKQTVFQSEFFAILFGGYVSVATAMCRCVSLFVKRGVTAETSDLRKKSRVYRSS